MLVRTAIRAAVPLPKVEAYQRYLFLGPHPDDIEIGAGATIQKLTEQGKTVTFLICTDGRFGDGASGGVEGDVLAALRERESIASAARLGVRDVRFLRLGDGGGYTTDELERGIARVIAEVQPDLVFAPDPDTRSECHADHIAVGQAAKKLVCFAPYGSLMRGARAGAGRCALYDREAEPVCADGRAAQGPVRGAVCVPQKPVPDRKGGGRAAAVPAAALAAIRYSHVFPRGGGLSRARTDASALPAGKRILRRGC